MRMNVVFPKSFGPTNLRTSRHPIWTQAVAVGRQRRRLIVCWYKKKESKYICRMSWMCKWSCRYFYLYRFTFTVANVEWNKAPARPRDSRTPTRERDRFAVGQKCQFFHCLIDRQSERNAPSSAVSRESHLRRLNRTFLTIHWSRIDHSRWCPTVFVTQEGETGASVAPR